MDLLEVFFFGCTFLFVLGFSLAWGMSLYDDYRSAGEEREGKCYSGLRVPVYGVLSVVFLGGYTWYGLVKWGCQLIAG